MREIVELGLRQREHLLVTTEIYGHGSQIGSVRRICQLTQQATVAHRHAAQVNGPSIAALCMDIAHNCPFMSNYE